MMLFNMIIGSYLVLLGLLLFAGIQDKKEYKIPVWLLISIYFAIGFSTCFTVLFFIPANIIIALAVLVGGIIFSIVGVILEKSKIIQVADVAAIVSAFTIPGLIAVPISLFVISDGKKHPFYFVFSIIYLFCLLAVLIAFTIKI